MNILALDLDERLVLHFVVGLSVPCNASPSRSKSCLLQFGTRYSVLDLTLIFRTCLKSLVPVITADVPLTLTLILCMVEREIILHWSILLIGVQL